MNCRELEEENANLQAEYERLRAKSTPGSTPEEQHSGNENRGAHGAPDQVTIHFYFNITLCMPVCNKLDGQITKVNCSLQCFTIPSLKNKQE